MQNNNLSNEEYDAITKKEYNLAFKLYSNLSELNDPVAKYYLGYLY